MKIVVFLGLILFSSISCVTSNKNSLTLISNDKLQTIEAVTTYVYDGDTFKAKYMGIDLKVRLFGIDAPEKKQPYGKKSLKNLIKLIKHKKIILEPVETDRYGRMIAKVYTIKKGVKTYVNLEQVKAGFAWHYKRYAKNEKDLAKAEVNAKKLKLGLWNQENPINPEKYRRKKK